MPPIRAAKVHLCAVLSLLSCLAVCATAKATPAIWTAHAANGAEIILFGSAPAATLDGPWRSRAFDEALARADDIWLEAPSRPSAVTLVRAFTLIAQNGGLPSGQSLSSLLNPDSRDRLGRLAPKLGLEPRKLDAMQPWWADLSTALALQDRNKGRDRNGVERYLSLHAPHRARMHAFDTVLHDLQGLATTPRNEQLADLEFALKRRELDLEPLEPRTEDWLAGDATAMAHETVDLFRTRAPRTSLALVHDRHALWADQISRAVQPDRRVLVVVSIANLIGPDGLPALLRQRGLTVDGP